MKIQLNIHTSLVVIVLTIIGFYFLLQRDVPRIEVNNLVASEFAGKIAVGPEDLQVAFSCDSKKSILAVFRLTAERTLDLALSDGRVVSLEYVPDDANPHYATSNGSIRFWSTGEVTFLTENGQRTYTQCSLSTGPMGV
jgi:membrane-bound inhibitor of C-type lysozyme